jgi:hypothetical protein
MFFGLYLHVRKLSLLDQRKECLFYTRVRELLREMLVEVGLYPNEYGTHSLRRGGATASAVNNVCDKTF